MSESRVPPPTVETLTPRQREVLALLAKGRTNFEIAEALGVSLEGAKYHVREIMGRLGVESREEAAAWWEVERRASVRLRRGFARFVPRLAIAAVLLLLVSGVGVVVAFAVTAGGGGQGAPAYVPVCGEGDVALALESELRPSSSGSGAPAVLLHARFEKTGAPCYLGGELRLTPVGASQEDTLRLSSSAPVDTVLAYGGSVTFRLENWCESAPRVDVVAQLGGATARHLLDHPPQDCAKLVSPACLLFETSAPSATPTSVPCPAPVRLSLYVTPSSVNTFESLERCDPRKVLGRIDTSPGSVPIAPGLATAQDHPEVAWRFRSVLEGTPFGLNWAMADRPRDCEYQGGVRIRLLDSAGNELAVEDEGATESVLLRFRRTTAPRSGEEPRMHVPGTGGSGDYGSESSLVSYSEVSRWVWGNWCGEDRTTATL